MLLPVRKCKATGRLLLLLALTVTVLALVERWRGGQRAAGAAEFGDQDQELEAQVLADEALQVPGLGALGAAVELHGEDKRLGEESMLKYDINVYLSDRIPYNRTLRDPRNPLCDRVVYDAELPSASVIIIFHNEPYSVLLRTVWSVLNSARRDQPWYRRANYLDKDGNTMKLGYPGQEPSSEYVYLREIILVDDNSTLPELRDKLSYYVRTRMPPGLVRIVRLPERQGLTRARLAGAHVSRGDALLFADAHCEMISDWLRPLLQRLKGPSHRVAFPVINEVDRATFQYIADETCPQIGGFTFDGHFMWINIPDREMKRRGSDIDPILSPTMAGGLFAMDRAYFWELGGYDEQMNGWGGENLEMSFRVWQLLLASHGEWMNGWGEEKLEMSFRVWQCGGTLECVPCSRVGHIFRSFHPYALPASSDTHGLNTARMAEVWMDEYAELFYLIRPDLRRSDAIGDIQHRKILRDKLHCKSFQWYLDNVYPEKFIPVRDVVGFGRFRNPATEMCIDVTQRGDTEHMALGAYPCYSTLASSQFWSLTAEGVLRNEIMHAEVPYSSPNSSTPRRVELVTCTKKVHRRDVWRYLAGGRLQHAATGLCLEAPARQGDLVAAPCDPARSRQSWTIDFTEHGPIEAGVVPVEQQLRLRKIRSAGAQRRRSRSLLSLSHLEQAASSTAPRTALHTAPTARAHGKRHGDTKLKKTKGKGGKKTKTKTKNKFILRLLRTRNHTTEHLELDVTCRHRTLLPNDTFVRDLVTTLTDADITVINNGRVFERVRPPPAAPAPSPPSAAPRQPPAVPRTYKVKAARVWGALPEAHKRKRIIVEDFVALPPPHPVVQPTEQGKHVKIRPTSKNKKHKHRRTHSSPLPPPSTARPLTTTADSKPEREQSEDSSYEGDERRNNAAAEPDWQLDEAGAIPAEPSRPSADTPASREPDPEPPISPPDARNESIRDGSTRDGSARDESIRGGSTRDGSARDRSARDGSVRDARRRGAQSPVKLVLRSNLTFNLGDEFFAWRRQGGGDEMAEALNELAIPINTTSHARFEPSTATDATPDSPDLPDSEPERDNDKGSGAPAQTRRTPDPADISSRESESVSLEFT